MIVSEVTIYEQFTFCLNTIMSDISAHFPQVRDEIVKMQVDLLQKLTDEICQYGSSVFHEDHEDVNGYDSEISGNDVKSPPIIKGEEGSIDCKGWLRLRLARSIGFEKC